MAHNSPACCTPPTCPLKKKKELLAQTAAHIKPIMKKAFDRRLKTARVCALGLTIAGVLAGAAATQHSFSTAQAMSDEGAYEKEKAAFKRVMKAAVERAAAMGSLVSPVSSAGVYLCFPHGLPPPQSASAPCTSW